MSHEHSEYVLLTTDILLQATTDGFIYSSPCSVTKGEIVRVVNNLLSGDAIISYRGQCAYGKEGVDFRRLSAIEHLALAAD